MLTIENAIHVGSIAMIVLMEHIVMQTIAHGMPSLPVGLKHSIIMEYAKQCVQPMLCPIQLLKLVITAAYIVQNARPR